MDEVMVQDRDEVGDAVGLSEAVRDVLEVLDPLRVPVQLAV